MITITIKTDNAAFQDGNRRAEITAILRELTDLFDRYKVPDGHAVRDTNGNTVGHVTLSGKDRKEL